VASTVCSLLVTFLIELGVLIAILLLLGNMVLPWIPALLMLVVIQTVFVLGVALLLSVLNVYFRDIKHFIAISLQALFYSAPIVYPLSVVEQAGTRTSFPLVRVYELNPLVRLIEAYRDVLYDLRFPPLHDLVYLVGWAVGLLVAGLWVFRRLDRRLAEEV
jgi:ABC-type polysaccharide/polyol phosphate export permease